MQNDSQTVGATGEFGVIDRIVATAGADTGGGVIIGPGDDAAVVAAPDQRVVISTDVYVEGRHFRQDWSSAEDIGHRVVASALADIAAMGARATSVVIGLACPAQTELRWLDSFSLGVRDECATAGAALVGGDMSSSDAIVISVTALGDLGGHAAVARSGALPGDVVAVAGTLGHAAAGLAILSRGFRSGKAFIEAHRRPQPPYTEGPRALAHGAHAMCDVSDGLLADLGHIAKASGVWIDVVSASFEIPPRMAEIAGALGADPLQWITAGGEDHALAATYPPDCVPEGWRVVGEVREAAVEGPRVTLDGVPQEVTGWTHFGDR
ncbi:MAG: thiamine-phosphate kinase [Cumulibacter sp.]